MAKEKKQIKEIVEDKISGNCNDKLCPFHGSNPVKLRGRTFEGNVIRKFPQRVVIQFERLLYVPKYERYEKRKTKLHARLPDCLKNEINLGDYVQIQECRPLSKIIHFMAVKKIRSAKEKIQ
jgi:small subunit ribosomal protein S17